MEFLCDLTYNITMSRIHASVQGLVFQSVMRQDITFFDNNKPGLLFIDFMQDLSSTLTLSHSHTFSLSLLPLGELVSHVTTNTNTMSEALSEELSLVMWYTGRLAFLLFFMVSQSWKLTLLSCMSLPIIWVVTKVFGYISQVKHTCLSVSTLPLLDNIHHYFHGRNIFMSVFQSISKEVMDSLAKSNQVATETFSYIKTVKCFANEDGETEKYRAKLDKTYALNKKEAAAYASSMCANSVSRLH